MQEATPQNTQSIVMLFPGQGSQSIGMLQSWAGNTLVQQTFAQASEVLQKDLWKIAQQGPAEVINQTEITQPLLLTASIALWRQWQASGLPQPALAAGHSLGEFSALVASESLALEEAVKLVNLRGQYMQSAVPVGQGGMSAVIGLADDKVQAVCEAHNQQYAAQGVTPANFNAPGQVVVSGSLKGLEMIADSLKEAGAKKIVPLPVSAPFHSQYMQPAAERFAQALQEVSISSPAFPVIQNATLSASQDPKIIAKALVNQLTACVPWTRTIELIVEQQGELSKFYECGPGKVLCGLNKRINRALASVALEQPDQFTL